jgi:hypothetical protein
MDGVDVTVIGCVCVANIGGVSHTHVIIRTTILLKSVGSVIEEDVSDMGNISVSDLSYFSIQS